MSRLEELLQQYCPNGVEYKKLSEIATVTRGGSLQKKDFTESGVPCIHYGQIHTKYGISTDKALTFVSEEIAAKQKMARYGNIVMAVTSENVEDVCKCVVWFGREDAAVSGHTAIISHNQNAKYLAYYFRSAGFFEQKRKLAHGTKVIEVTPDKLNDTIIPVPPRPVQDEIVRILDSYTAQVVELKRQISVELEKRRIQNNKEKNKLMAFDSSIPYTRLDTFFPNIRNGFVGTVTKHFSDKEHGVRYLEGRNVHAGVISNDEEIYVTKEFHLQHIRTELKLNDIVMVQSGHVGECAVVGPEIVGANCHALIIMSNGGHCNSRFMMHYFQSDEGKAKLAKITTGETVKHILASAMQKFMVPAITCDEQDHIVDILDRLDMAYIKLKTELNEEIVIRQKQYEYYRDKLLSFKEA